VVYLNIYYSYFFSALLAFGTYIRVFLTAMKAIIFCVTNDLYFDRRMHKICTTLHTAGYDVMLVGRKGELKTGDFKPPYACHRLPCLFSRGPLFYFEYQIRLLLFLLFQRKALLCAIDLDTMPAVYFASSWKSLPRIVDAHELFTEQKEVISRRWVHFIWLKAERWLVPRFPHGYTVNRELAEEFFKRYAVNYSIIRNVPVTLPIPEIAPDSEQWIIYQGAVNEGRSFETLIPAMKKVSVPLHIYGKGNFLQQAKQLVEEHDLQGKVVFHPPVLPDELVQITPHASIGITLFENKGLNQYWSLANRFFDYIMAGVPQICSDFPAYRELLKLYPVGLPVDAADPEAIAAAMNKLLTDGVVYEQCKSACREARKEVNWEKEQEKLLDFYTKLSG
jgi:glycosyltransferase involved in cell wall biosynthesis